jgi:hypothetical protein
MQSSELGTHLISVVHVTFGVKGGPLLLILSLVELMMEASLKCDVYQF